MQQRGDEIGVLARAISDMTAALRHRIDAVETFGADLAHEIKNPFASLRSAIESMIKVKDEKLREQLAEVAVHDVRRIDRLVTEIAEASRIDAELSRATFEAIDLSRLIENAIKAREERGLNAGRKVELERDRRAARVLGVPLRIERVIENLLDNAVSFSPPDGTITVRVRRDADRVVMSVCDEGPGLSVQDAERIFESTFTTKRNGMGFGLSIVRSIVEMHHGKVWFEPNVPRGAVFRVWLPAIGA
jgi:two-component system sensor histidine kinase ChvG